MLTDPEANQAVAGRGRVEEEEEEEEEEDEEMWMRRKQGGTRMDDVKRWLAISFFVGLGLLVVIAALTAAPLLMEADNQPTLSPTSPPTNATALPNHRKNG
ncbi:hypothetical protein BASA81_000222 [Batrachochytrium salamandrivorans]|nr:hypothetical protein BASA81_000222 [Batrachochytrium salamandrivorans]